MRVLICLAFIVVCSAQVPQRCDSPKQWVGRRIRADRANQYFERASHSYDEVNRRTRSIEEREVGKERDYYDTLHLHNVGMEYRLNLRTKQCNVTKLTRPFRYIGVPDNAHFLFEAEIGAAQVPDEHLTAKTFDGKFEDGASYVVTVTSPDCIPIALDVHHNDSSNEWFHERYFDVKLGIDDPAVFIPPSECNQ
ncbi:Mammalian ependymin-related protein 1 [Mactra antiquata]